MRSEKATKTIRHVELISYEGSLRQTGLVSPENRMLRGDFIVAFQNPKWVYKKAGERRFASELRGRTRGNGWVVKHWHRLPKN